MIEPKDITQVLKTAFQIGRFAVNVTARTVLEVAEKVTSDENKKEKIREIKNNISSRGGL